MKHRARRLVSKVPIVVALCACVVVLAAQDACVLAAPSGELPRLPDSRPTIVHASLVPSTSSVISRFPSAFIVPVELADPTVAFVYAAFVDYNPFTGDGLVDAPRHVAPTNEPGRTRNVSVSIPAPTDTNRCHVIEVVVALRLKSETDGKTAHTPDDPGGDVATWFYNPSGDVGGCPALDAGIDAPVDADSGEGGAQ